MIALSELASKKLHFIGIGGAGMSGLARIALTHGAHVSGSDEKTHQYLQPFQHSVQQSSLHTKARRLQMRT